LVLEYFANCDYIVGAIKAEATENPLLGGGKTVNDEIGVDIVANISLICCDYIADNLAVSPLLSRC
jgi:hypothetical protein